MQDQADLRDRLAFGFLHHQFDLAEGDTVADDGHALDAAGEDLDEAEAAGIAGEQAGRKPSAKLAVRVRRPPSKRITARAMLPTM